MGHCLKFGPFIIGSFSCKIRIWVEEMMHFQNFIQIQEKNEIHKSKLKTEPWQCTVGNIDSHRSKKVQKWRTLLKMIIIVILWYEMMLYIIRIV